MGHRPPAAAFVRLAEGGSVESMEAATLEVTITPAGIQNLTGLDPSLLT